MATSPRFGIVVPDATSDNDVPQHLLELVTSLENIAPGISSYTTTQRNALTGTALWDNRIIWNSTADKLERYDAGGSVWVDAVVIPTTDPGIASFTTTERNGLSGAQLWEGRTIYNRTTDMLQNYTGSAWVDVAITDHGALGGKGDNDHPQYALLAGADFTGMVDLLRYIERAVTTAPAATTTINLNLGQTHIVTLNQNTTIALANVVGSANRAQTLTLVLKQDATGGRTITWPTAVKWPDGASPALSTAANAVNIVTMFTVDQGTNWYAFLSGRNMS